jgi:hypothetical protein
MRLRDRRDSADQRSDAERPRVRGDVGGHQCRLCGKLAAPGDEMGEVGLIGPAGVVGDAGLDQCSDLFGNRVSPSCCAGNCTNCADASV